MAVEGPSEELAPPGYRDGVIAALPLALVVGVFGVSFGVLARSAHLDGLAMVLMSLTTFAGSAQFAAISVLAHGGGVLSAVAAVAMLNARYVPIGGSVAVALHRHPLRRFLESQLVVDESWALATRAGRPNRQLLLGASAVLLSGWVGGTVLGVVGGGWVGEPGRFGLDAAFPALFLALLWPRLAGRRGQAAAATGAAVGLVLTPFAPVGVPLVCAAAGSLWGLRK